MGLGAKEKANSNILIVDDTPANLHVLSGMLKQRGYEVRPVPNGKLAIKAAKNQVPDLILMDINMPEMNGYEVCETFKRDPELKSVPIIFISALSETIDKVRAFAVGGVDYISKPFQIEEVNSRVETHLKLRQLQQNLELLVKEQVKEISESQIATTFALARLTQLRDDVTGTHLERVKNYCTVLATELSKHPDYQKKLTKEKIEILSLASALHDIGKVGIPDAVLLKPNRLTEGEFEQIKKHTIIGAETLEDVKRYYPKNAFISVGIEIAHYHHEKWDGSGYPDGLKGDEIPLTAQIMAVADVYDALKSVRCYKQSFDHAECVKIIEESEGKAFKSELVEAFYNVNREFLNIWEQYNKVEDIVDGDILNCEMPLL